MHNIMYIYIYIYVYICIIICVLLITISICVYIYIYTHMCIAYHSCGHQHHECGERREGPAPPHPHEPVLSRDQTGQSRRPIRQT